MNLMKEDMFHMLIDEPKSTDREDDNEDRGRGSRGPRTTKTEDNKDQGPRVKGGGRREGGRREEGGGESFTGYSN